MMEAGQKYGMQTMVMALNKLISKGMVRAEDVEGILLELEI
jgi:Tfp pilus assembly pilus retraction ATPase PilT